MEKRELQNITINNQNNANSQEHESINEESNTEEVRGLLDLEHFRTDHFESVPLDTDMLMENQANEGSELVPYSNVEEELQEEEQLHDNNREGTQEEQTEESQRNLADYNALIQELLKVFECSNCQRLIRPPIYQCSSGHLKCIYCNSQFLTHSSSACQECGVRCQRTRNVALDRIAVHLPFPCKNVAAGCNILQRLQNIEEHEEKECPYRKIACPYSQLGLCSYWNGTKLQLVNHIMYRHMHNMRMEHGYTGILYGQEVQLLPFIEAINYGSSLPTKAVMWTFIQKHLGNLFLINLYYRHNGIVNVHFITVRMISTVTSARRYRSKIALEGPNEELLCYEGVCNSIYENTDYIYINRDCLSFDSSTAIRYIKTLSNGHKTLKFNCKILSP